MSVRTNSRLIRGHDLPSGVSQSKINVPHHGLGGKPCWAGGRSCRKRTFSVFSDGVAANDSILLPLSSETLPSGGSLGQGLSFFEPQHAPPGARVEGVHRIRLNQRRDRNADRRTSAAAAAEKRAVISVCFFSKTSRVFRLW